MCYLDLRIYEMEYKNTGSNTSSYHLTGRHMPKSRKCEHQKQFKCSNIISVIEDYRLNWV
jgi:hypothetical protein